MPMYGVLFGRPIRIVINEEVRGFLMDWDIKEPESNLYLDLIPLGTQYSPLGQESLPSADDPHPFARVYHTLQGLVASGVLKGPFGEDHPAFWQRFDYQVSQHMKPSDFIRILEGVGLRVKAAYVPKDPSRLTREGAEQERLAAERINADIAPWFDQTLYDEVKIAEKAKVAEKETDRKEEPPPQPRRRRRWWFW